MEVLWPELGRKAALAGAKKAAGVAVARAGEPLPRATFESLPMM